MHDRVFRTTLKKLGAIIFFMARGTGPREYWAKFNADKIRPEQSLTVYSGCTGFSYDVLENGNLSFTGLPEMPERCITPTQKWATGSPVPQF
jgi:hypothetical protein